MLATSQTVTSRIRQLAAERGDESAITCVDRTNRDAVFTWSDLDHCSGQVASALRDKDVVLGDRVVVALPNGSEFIQAVLACWKLGAVPVPVRWDLPAWESARLEAVVQPRLWIGAADIGWLAATSSVVPLALPELVSPHIYGLCSGGSTGLPKVILSNRPATVLPTELAQPLYSRWEVVKRPQRIMVPAPMYHSAGFGQLQSLLAGDQLVVLERFDAGLALDVLERHKITTFAAAPTMLKRLADHATCDERDLSHIVWVMQGAAPMPPVLVRRWSTLIGATRLVLVYGMSEGIGMIAVRADEWMSHPGTIGQPTHRTEVRILDDAQRPLPPGEAGEIYLRSASYDGSSYLGDTPALRQDADGFTTVGDIGYVDADGWVYLLDRRVDVIISGGANVFPAEVEGALLEHPAITDVVVIGLKDPEWGRRVHAIIEVVPGKPAPLLSEIRDFSKDRLSAYKAPHSIEVTRESFRTPSGKVNRHNLVEERGG